jgi:hypothetical protein
MGCIHVKGPDGVTRPYFFNDPTDPIDAVMEQTFIYDGPESFRRAVEHQLANPLAQKEEAAMHKRRKEIIRGRKAKENWSSRCKFDGHEKNVVLPDGYSVNEASDIVGVDGVEVGAACEYCGGISHLSDRVPMVGAFARFHNRRQAQYEHWKGKFDAAQQ